MRLRAVVAVRVAPWLAASLLVAACGTARPALKPFDPHGSDPDALRVVDEMVGAMGGWQAWDRVAQLKWEYEVDNDTSVAADVLHAWDRRDQRHTMEEWFQKQLIVVMQSLRDPSDGFVTIGNTKASADASDPLLAEAENRFENDSYSLVAPFRLHDPGVHLRYQGTSRLDDGTEADVVRVTFDPGTRATPKDTYWFYVSRATHLPARWEYILQAELDNNDTGGAVPRLAVAWSDWEQIGPIKLSLHRTYLRGPVEIHFKNVSASEKIDRDLFVPYTTGYELAFGNLGTPLMPTLETPGAGTGNMVVQ